MFVLSVAPSCGLLEIVSCGSGFVFLSCRVPSVGGADRDGCVSSGLVQHFRCDDGWSSSMHLEASSLMFRSSVWLVLVTAMYGVLQL